MDKAEFDRFADEYYNHHSQNVAITGEAPEYFAEYKINELKKITVHNQISVSRIFDFGSGIGNSIPFFRKYFPAAECTSADVSVRSLELSKLRFPDVENLLLIEGDRIPAQGEAFDVTFSACVFHHIPHDEHVMWLRELHRITRRGGMIAIFEHTPLNPLTVRAVNTCAKLILARDLKARLQSAGWKDSSIQYNVFFPRALALLRPLERQLQWLPLGAQYVAVARKD